MANPWSSPVPNLGSCISYCAIRAARFLGRICTMRCGASQPSKVTDRSTTACCACARSWATSATASKQCGAWAIASLPGPEARPRESLRALALAADPVALAGDRVHAAEHDRRGGAYRKHLAGEPVEHG